MWISVIVYQYPQLFDVLFFFVGAKSMSMSPFTSIQVAKKVKGGGAKKAKQKGKARNFLSKRPATESGSAVKSNPEKNGASWFL